MTAAPVIDVVARELDKIAEQHEGVLRPRDVVEAARPARHPLHSRFEWDNTEAGRLYRLHQARQLIRIVSYRVEQPSEADAMPAAGQLREWHSIRRRDAESRTYERLGDIAADPEATTLLLNRLRREAEALKRRYSNVVGALEVVRAVFVGHPDDED